MQIRCVKQPCSIMLINLNLIIIGVYRPPRADDSSFRQCLEKIDSFIRSHENADIQMMGDLNMPYMNWQAKEVIKHQLLKSEVSSAHRLLSFMENHMLNQLVTETTRKDISILDLVLTNNQDAIHSIEVEKTALSDHDFVWINLLYSKLTIIPDCPSSQPDSPLDNLNLNKADYESIRSDLSKINWMEILGNKDVEEMHSLITSTLIDSCIQHAPAHTNKGKKNQHIPPKRRTLLKIRKRLNGKINKCKFLKQPGFEGKLEKFYKRKSSLEIEIRDSIREEALKKEKDVIEKIKINPRAFFAYAKKKSKTATTIGPLVDKENKLQSDPTKMSNLLQEQYTHAFSDPDSGNTDQPYPDTSNIPQFDYITIIEEEIIKAINEISLNSAPGTDKIPARLIKECKHQLAAALVILWQKSIDSGQIPTDLLKQSIIPIFKKDNKSLPSNYRPISLTSHLIKILERVLRDKLVQHLEENHLITPYQHGFRVKRSTLTQLLHHFDNFLSR